MEERKSGGRAGGGDGAWCLHTTIYYIYKYINNIGLLRESQENIYSTSQFYMGLFFLLYTIC